MIALVTWETKKKKKWVNKSFHTPLVNGSHALSTWHKSPTTNISNETKPTWSVQIKLLILRDHHKFCLLIESYLDKNFLIESYLDKN